MTCFLFLSMALTRRIFLAFRPKFPTRSEEKLRPAMIMNVNPIGSRKERTASAAPLHPPQGPHSTGSPMSHPIVPSARQPSPTVDGPSSAPRQRRQVAAAINFRTGRRSASDRWMGIGHGMQRLSCSAQLSAESLRRARAEAERERGKASSQASSLTAWADQETA